MNDVPVITIDGPSGTGKGTLTVLLAKALGWQSDLGSFEKGKKPGVNLLMGCSYNEGAAWVADAHLRLTEGSYVKRLV